MLSMLKEALEWLNRAGEAREVAGQLTDPGARKANSSRHLRRVHSSADPFGKPSIVRVRCVHRRLDAAARSTDQRVARSGTIELRLFCLTCWSNMTRLLKTPIIGRSETIVPSS